MIKYGKGFVKWGDKKTEVLQNKKEKS